VVGGHRLGRINIKDDYFIIAEFRNIDPIMQQQARELGMQEVASGLKSKQTYMESDLQIANVSEERKRIIKEKTRETLPYLDVMAEAIAKEDGMEEAYRRSKQQENKPGGGEAESASLSPEAGGTLTESMNGAMRQVR
jgi:3-deoxy-D-manno-octulosonate 8-phosphate phosphatase KdsC-like HAD superfamily phosphatase